MLNKDDAAGDGLGAVAGSGCLNVQMPRWVQSLVLRWQHKHHLVLRGPCGDQELGGLHDRIRHREVGGVRRWLVWHDWWRVGLDQCLLLGKSKGLSLLLLYKTEGNLGSLCLELPPVVRAQ